MREPLLVITECIVGCHCLKHIMPMFGFQMVYTYQWFGFCGITITNLYLFLLIVLCRLLCTCTLYASICLLAHCWSKFFYSPTDAQVNCLKSNFKIYIKVDIKTAPTSFSAVTPSSGSTLLVLDEVTVVKIAN